MLFHIVITSSKFVHFINNILVKLTIKTCVDNGTIKKNLELFLDDATLSKPFSDPSCPVDGGMVILEETTTIRIKMKHSSLYCSLGVDTLHMVKDESIDHITVD